MLQFYPCFKKLIFGGFVLLSTAGYAQNQTFVFPSQNCADTVQNFSGNDGGFSSGVAAGGDPFDDSTFFYNQRRGFWTELGENSAERTVPPFALPLPNRRVPIISPLYASPTLRGFFDIGFTYVVPEPTTDQFAIRIIRQTTFSNGSTFNVQNDEAANSSPLTFAAYTNTAITPYTDPFGNTVLTGQRGHVCLRLRDEDITVGPNIRYRIEITYRVRTGGTFTVFDNLTLGNASGIPLPVNFTGLVAKRTSTGSVDLKWDVAQERNVKEYVVERSASGNNFIAVGSVLADNKSSYSFNDESATTGSVFYRIRNIDHDGRSMLSSTVKISGSSSFSNTFKMYPMPAGNMVTIEHPALPVGSEITIRTAEGQIVRRFQPRASVSHTPLDLTGVVSGMYLIHINTGDGNGQTLKLIKK